MRLKASKYILCIIICLLSLFNINSIFPEKIENYNLITNYTGNSVVDNKLELGIKKLKNNFNLESNEIALITIISEQKLFVIKNNQLIIDYPVSTSKYGIGNIQNSNRTPLGTHRIQAKIGNNAPIGTIFRGKMDTGEIAEIIYYIDETKELGKSDYITTRVLPLDGLEQGINKGPGIDSFERYIYIHGTQEEALIGQPASQGCIRMRNVDVIELFNIVRVGTLLEIME